MSELWNSFRESSLYTVVGVAIIALCFLEILKRCRAYYQESRGMKAEAKAAEMCEKEQMGTEVWEKDAAEK